MFKFLKILKPAQASLFKLIQAYKWYVLIALLTAMLCLFMLSACAPFQLNLPGSCSIFSNPEKAPQSHHEAPVENKKKGFFRKH